MPNQRDKVERDRKIASQQHPKAPRGKHWDKDLHQFVKDSLPRPEVAESVGAKEFMRKVEQAKRSPTLRKSSRLKEAEQGTGVGVGAAVAPITPEKPATPTERMDAMDAKLAEIQEQISVIEGIISALKPHAYSRKEEV